MAAGGENDRVAVNVPSDGQSEVFVHYDPNYTTASPALDPAALAGGQQGLTPLPTGPDGKELDDLRDNLFDVASMQQVPDIGSTISLGNLLDGRIERAKADGAALAVIPHRVRNSAFRRSRGCTTST